MRNWQGACQAIGVTEDFSIKPPLSRWTPSAAFMIGFSLFGTLIMIGLCASGLIAAGQKAATPLPATLTAARQVCDPSVFTATLADNDRTMLVEADDQRGMTTVACLARELKMPDAVVAQVDSTRAIDGRCSAQWPGYRASWTYHPKSGLNMIIEVMP